jgi:outer membrane protein OmpA-like peptidoglycan-associated protein
MEPTQTPPTNQSPQPPLTPAPPTQPAVPAQPAAPIPPTPVTQPQKKSKAGLVIGIVLGVLLLLGALIAVGVYLVWSSDVFQSKTRSMAFMQEITVGNIDSALAYTDGSQESRQVIESLAPSVRATGFSEENNSERDNSWYYLYRLNGGTNAMARTTLKKENGKWIVVSLVAGGDNLAVVPASSPDDSVPTSATAPSGLCLVSTDFDEWYKNGTGLGKTATSYGFDFSKAETSYSTNVKFEPDSLEYTQANITKTFVEDIAELAKAVEGKQYTVRLYGSVATTAPADISFADQRSNKVKSELIALGVPADKISVEKSQNIEAISDPELRNEITKAGARGVHIDFDPTCTTTSGQR